MSPPGLKMNFNTQQFVYDKSTQTLSADASCLGFGVGYWPQEIVVVSHHTGNKVLFSFAETMKNRDGDVVGRNYKPTGTFRPKCKLTIYND